MNRTAITPEMIEASLRAVYRGGPPDSELLSILVSGGFIREADPTAAVNWLYDLVWELYSALREAEGLPDRKPAVRQELLDLVAEDFRTQNGSLAALSAVYSRYLSLCHLSVKELSQAASVVPQQFRRRLKQGLGLIAQRLSSSVSDHKKTTPMRPDFANLPLPEYTSLIGVDSYIDLLSRLLTDPDGPRLVSLEGIGGIGKSALARAFIGLPETSARSGKTAWVSARQTVITEDGRLVPASDPAATLEDITARLCDQLGLTALALNSLDRRLDGLKAALAKEKHLIVVDNLETVEDYLDLVPTLARISGNSRFLLTTRQTLREFPFVHTLPLKALNRERSFELVKAEIARRGRSPEAISDASFDELYAVTGGHPLALKLVAAQLFLRPLAEILEGFRKARVGIDNLYRYLYWQTWQSLSDPARQLLLSFLPSDPEGEDLEFLQMMSGQGEEAFYSALRELDQFSLIECAGDVERPLYRLHSLTITFLQTDILRLWTGEPANVSHHAAG